jgi:formate C-acetyltransferase
MAVATAARSARFARIKQELLGSRVHLCPERAYLVTEFARHHDDPSQPMIVRRAMATRFILQSKPVKVWPDELIAGNMGGHRISALMQPELSGVYMGTELPWIDRRKTTPLQMSWQDRLRMLFDVLPFWLFRNMPFLAFYPRMGRFLRYAGEQLKARYYLINEAGGIGHFLPDYGKVLRLGVNGYLDLMEGRGGDIYRAARIACQGLLDYAWHVADEAERLAREETEPGRKEELQQIARNCRRVPANPAGSFHEALQSLWLTHMAVCLEGINSAVSFGRLDQYLYPFYKHDLEAGRITREQAKELLLCFSAKAAEHVFLLSESVSQYHGGYLVVQAAIVGGMDREGNDATNELTSILLDVMEESGLRDPNYQARVHRGSPDEYLERVLEVARSGHGVPAVFSDEASVQSLVDNGYPVEEARDYAVVGCVELALPGRSFLSTDAALVNLPICLEMALNSGRLLGGGGRKGASTGDVGDFASIDDAIKAFESQVNFMVSRLVDDIQVAERGNRDYHPTAFSSMLVAGCLESGKDITAGGALYNGSGVQGVGLADVADSLAALQTLVFEKKKYSIRQVVKALKDDFRSYPEMRAEMLAAPKYGNDQALPDGYACQVAEIFYRALGKHTNTRGGRYVPGFYSVTCHVAFGGLTGALPSGRKRGEPFASSIGAGNGRDRLGPTALLNSVSCIEPRLSPNGYALNLRFDPAMVEGERGIKVLGALVRGFFEKGGMELQFNILDPEMLEDACRHPGKYPGLVVRVAGYCAYFDDLPQRSKLEIIQRTRLKI